MPKKAVNIVEEAKEKYQGKHIDKTQWRKVKIGSHSLTVERAPESIAKIELDSIKVSSVCDRREYKERCELCLCFYEKTSVSFSVPNHRIIDLQRSWNFIREGKRYSNASFLYTFSRVCMFCAQLFSDVDDDLPPFKSLSTAMSISTSSDMLDGRSVSSSTIGDATFAANMTGLGSPTKSVNNNGSNNNAATLSTTIIERSDLAKNQRCYQSSVVDHYDAAHAVMPPYELPAKTRRAADQWWELDFGRTQHVKSVHFMVCTGIQQKLHVNVLLLRKPVGFEDPFLDSAIGKAVQFKEFVVTESEQSKMEQINWEVPASSYCAAIRIQLRGLSTLTLQRFQAYQGDDCPTVEIGADFNFTANSFATLSPMAIKKGLADMMTHKQRRQRAFKGIQKAKTFDVEDLAQNIKNKLAMDEEWKDRVLQTTDLVFIDPSEIAIVLKAIFLFTFENDLKTPNKNKDGSKVDENNMLDGALLYYYPRCALKDIVERIKNIMRWIQAKSHLSLLGPLLQNEIFVDMAAEIDDYMYKLLRAVKKIEKYWQENAENPKTDPGCSWSQCLLFVSLFVMKEIERIPFLVFGIGRDPSDPTAAEKDTLPSLSKSYMSPTKPATANTTKRISTNAELSRSLAEMHAAVKTDSKNYEFCRFKLGVFSNRQKRHNIDFPKALSLDFAASLVPTRAGTSSHRRRSSTDSTDEILATVSNGYSAAETAMFATFTNPAASSSSFFTADATGNGEQRHHDNIFHRVCTLCYRKHPVVGPECKVLWKHVVTLRRSWDPSLIPEDMEILDVSTSVYNLVPVCTFCSQYFDPDFEGGIAFPMRELREMLPEGFASKLEIARPSTAPMATSPPDLPIEGATVAAHKAVPFYDDRYVDGTTVNLGIRHYAVKSRHSAQRANAVTRAVMNKSTANLLELMEEEKN